MTQKESKPLFSAKVAVSLLYGINDFRRVMVSVIVSKNKFLQTKPHITSKLKDNYKLSIRIFLYAGSEIGIMFLIPPHGLLTSPFLRVLHEKII